MAESVPRPCHVCFETPGHDQDCPYAPAGNPLLGWPVHRYDGTNPSEILAVLGIIEGDSVIVTATGPVVVKGPDWDKLVAWEGDVKVHASYCEEGPNHPGGCKP